MDTIAFTPARGDHSWLARMLTLDLARRFSRRGTFWENRPAIGAMGRADVICCRARAAFRAAGHCPRELNCESMRWFGAIFGSRIAVNGAMMVWIHLFSTDRFMNAPWQDKRFLEKMCRGKEPRTLG